jgi:hypothetical protein
MPRNGRGGRLSLRRRTPPPITRSEHR